MHKLNIDKESPEYTEGDQVTAPGMIEVLNRIHNIALVSQEAVPERLKGHTLIVYLPERDFIVLAGWGENTALIAELVAEYLELTPPQHERALKAPIHIGLSGKLLKIWQTLEAIYQIRNKDKE